MLIDGKIMGQIIFMRTEIKCDDGKLLPIVTAGPLAIAPEYKRQGYGKAFWIMPSQKLPKWVSVPFALKATSAFTNIAVSLMLPILASVITVCLKERMHRFLCKELKQGYLNGIQGEYATPQGYFVDENECKEFDRQFPPKEKLRLPGQIF